MTDDLRDRIADALRSVSWIATYDEFADAIIEELGLRYEYENGRVFYTEKPAACKPNGNWKYRVCSDLQLYEEN